MKGDFQVHAETPGPAIEEDFLTPAETSLSALVAQEERVRSRRSASSGGPRVLRLQEPPALLLGEPEVGRLASRESNLAPDPEPWVTDALAALDGKLPEDQRLIDEIATLGDPPDPPAYVVGVDVAAEGTESVSVEVEVYDPWWDAPFSALLGGAGVGKTFLCRDWAANVPGTVLAATTGIAAINLGGQTINGLLGYYNTESLHDSYVSGLLSLRLAKLKKAGLRRIILDEVSMLDGEQLTIFTKALDELAGGLGYSIGLDAVDEPEEELPENPTHPVGLTLVGDFAQLPPVKAPFAFESPEWGKYEANLRMLTHIHRQTDVDFITALRAARRGDGKAALAYFAERMVPTTDEHYDGPTLLAKNDAVFRYNDLRLTKLPGPTMVYTSTRWLGDDEKGRQRKEPSEWKHIPATFPLKAGALVMILANTKDPMYPERFIYVNGDLGTYRDDQHGNAVVTLQRTGEDVVVTPITRNVTIPLEVGRRKQLKAERKEHLIDGRKEIVASVTYMPLRLAWATTVHKSQGLSLDKVQVNVGDPFFRTGGMVYVALSRARTAEGLRLVGRPETFAARCNVDPKVVAWL